MQLLGEDQRRRKAPNARRVTCIVGIVVILSVSGSVVAFRQTLYEQWLIYRLDSKQETVRISAAEKLAELRGFRAAPYVVDLIRESDTERLEWKAEASGWVRILTPLLYCLYRIGPEAEGYLRKVIQKEKEKLGKKDFKVEQVSPTWFLPPQLTPIVAAIVHPQEKKERLMMYLREVILSWRFDFIKTRRAGSPD